MMTSLMTVVTFRLTLPFPRHIHLVCNSHLWNEGAPVQPEMVTPFGMSASCM